MFFNECEERAKGGQAFHCLTSMKIGPKESLFQRDKWYNGMHIVPRLTKLT